MTAPAPWSHQINFAAVPASVPMARRFARQHLVDHGEPDHLADDLEIVVSELATNAVIYAGTPFSVAIQGSPGVVVVEVIDGGAGDLAAVATTPNHGTSGRGLALVEMLSDEWGVNGAEPDGKVVWARFCGR